MRTDEGLWHITQQLGLSLKHLNRSVQTLPVFLFSDRPQAPTEGLALKATVPLASTVDFHISGKG